MSDMLLFRNLFIQRKERIYQKRIDMSEISNRQVISRFRFKPDSNKNIADLLRDDLERNTHRGRAISVEMQVMLALGFYASGSFLEVIGDTMGVDKGTVSRAIESVTNALLLKKDQFIKWPSNAEMAQSRKTFYQVGGYPGVIGCVDGTHIRIQAPSMDEPTYVNRKGRHSINVQAICNPEGRFINVDAQWPGSSHDSHIFRASEVCMFLENTHRGIEDGFLLGDSGYACSRFLLTPFLHPSTPAQEANNAAHTQTRCTIERVFGWWKRRFHVLHSEIRMKPGKVCRIIGACAILHNIALNLKEEMEEGDENQDDNNVGQINYQGPEDGRPVRNLISTNYFQTDRNRAKLYALISLLISI